MFQTIARLTVASVLAAFLLTAVPALACGTGPVPVQGETLQMQPVQVETVQEDLFDHVRTQRTARLSTDG